MNKEYQQVREFMRAFGQEVPAEVGMPSEETIAMRHALIEEETFEFSNAARKCNMVEAFDAVLDLLYVALGAGVDCGFTPEQIAAGFEEVHRSNMSKMWTRDECLARFPTPTIEASFVQVGDDHYIVRRADGKIVKSPSYSPANLGQILENKE